MKKFMLVTMCIFLTDSLYGNVKEQRQHNIVYFDAEEETHNTEHHNVRPSVLRVTGGVCIATAVVVGVYIVYIKSVQWMNRKQHPLQEHKIA